MNGMSDTVSSFVSRSVDILFVQNPRGTSVGALTGVCADGLVKFFGPFLKNYSHTFDASQLQTYHLIVAGIVLLNIPAFFKRRELPNEVEDAFESIRRSRKDLTPLQVRMQYLRLCTDVIARAQPSGAKDKSDSASS